MTKITVGRKGKLRSQRDRWTCVPAEDIKKDEWLAFSFNPIEQPDLSSPNGFAIWYGRQHKVFNQLHYCELEKVVCEVSPKGRFHFHGNIKITSVIKFYGVTLLELQGKGAYEIDTVADWALWNKYCRKQEAEMLIFMILEAHKSQPYEYNKAIK